jgi:putative spermidine/putrescine transport system ATP-binding protein
MSPTNAFVARFIGAMNELPARVVDSQTVELFGNFFSAIAGMDVGHVVLLVRPDAVRVTPPGVTGTIAAEVIEVVFSGSASVLRLMVDHQGHQTQLDSVVWSRDLQHTPGDRVGIEIELNRAVFEHR